MFKYIIVVGKGSPKGGKDAVVVVRPAQVVLLVGDLERLHVAVEGGEHLSSLFPLPPLVGLGRWQGPIETSWNNFYSKFPAGAVKSWSSATIK